MFCPSRSPFFDLFSFIPDIYTQLFDDNTDLNNSYPNIDQEFANIPDVDELIEISELDREKDHDHCR